ncbi:prepilin-type N-terminal cleavage/methylation domain-containing protein [Candidatus Saccharibacteria bacterium]|nr:prepilin-type N-terminal cleavage/methylation domain-containing protein [Candidatus Saccharibacteria bacterium]
MYNKRSRQIGFTIVELLIVIVVIGILATITAIAYSGVQQSARDTQRKDDLAKIATGLHLYAVDKGDYVTASGSCPSGWSGSGGGWYASDYDGAGPQISISQCIVNGGYLSKTINDPQSVKSCTVVPDTSPVENDCFMYMKYDCAGSTYLYANLESMAHSSTDTNGSCMTTLDSSYGMNYSLKVN